MWYDNEIGFRCSGFGVRFLVRPSRNSNSGLEIGDSVDTETSGPKLETRTPKPLSVCGVRCGASVYRELQAETRIPMNRDLRSALVPKPETRTPKPKRCDVETHHLFIHGSKIIAHDSRMLSVRIS